MWKSTAAPKSDGEIPLNRLLVGIEGETVFFFKRILAGREDMMVECNFYGMFLFGRDGGAILRTPSRWTEAPDFDLAEAGRDLEQGLKRLDDTTGQ